MGDSKLPVFFAIALADDAWRISFPSPDTDLGLRPLARSHWASSQPSGLFEGICAVLWFMSISLDDPPFETESELTGAFLGLLALVGTGRSSPVACELRMQP